MRIRRVGPLVAATAAVLLLDVGVVHASVRSTRVTAAAVPAAPVIVAAATAAVPVSVPGPAATETPAAVAATPAAVPTPAPTSTALSGLAVASRTLTVTDGSRTLPTLVYAPSAAGTYPLIVFVHGWDSSPAVYDALLRAWASAGYVVAAPTFPFTNSADAVDEADMVNEPADVSAVITALLTAPDVDPAAGVGVAGHSDGAMVALATGYATAYRDPRVMAVEVLEGAADTATFGAYAAEPAALLVAQSDTDEYNAEASGLRAYAVDAGGTRGAAPADRDDAPRPLHRPRLGCLGTRRRGDHRLVGPASVRPDDEHRRARSSRDCDGPVVGAARLSVLVGAEGACARGPGQDGRMSRATQTDDPLLRARNLLAPGTIAALSSGGYLDLLGAEPPPAPRTVAQTAMEFPPLALVYEKWWRPAFTAVLGLRVPGMNSEIARSQERLDLAGEQVVVDVACGPGLFTASFGRALTGDGLAIGVDVSVPMLRRAVKDNSGPNVAYVRADARHLPFEDSSVDAVCCLAALYLVPEPFQVISDMIRILKPGGRIVIMTSARTQWDVLRLSEPLLAHTAGLRLFGRNEITGALLGQGMQAVHREIRGLTQLVTGVRPG